MSDPHVEKVRLKNSRFYNLFGRGYPQRNLELGFTRSPTSKRVKKPDTSILSISKGFKELSKNVNGIDKLKL